MAAKLAALSHPARIGILLQLAGSGPSCCKQVVARFDLAQSTVSQHLKVLVEAGLVRLSASAQRSVYEIDSQALAQLSDSFSGLAARCCLPVPASEQKESAKHG
jgi:ArsR family transcriptional regulator